MEEQTGAWALCSTVVVSDENTTLSHPDALDAFPGHTITSESGSPEAMIKVVPQGILALDLAVGKLRCFIE